MYKKVGKQAVETSTSVRAWAVLRQNMIIIEALRLARRFCEKEGSRYDQEKK
jgi:hypothetical protein